MANDNSLHFNGLFTVIMSALGSNPPSPQLNPNAENIGKLYANEISKLIPRNISEEDTHLRKSGKIDLNYCSRINKKLEDLRGLCTSMQNARDTTISGRRYTRNDLIFFYLHKIAETLNAIKDELSDIRTINPRLSNSPSSLFPTPTTNKTTSEISEKAEKKSLSTKVYDFFIGLFSSDTSSVSSLNDYEQSDQDLYMRMDFK